MRRTILTIFFAMLFATPSLGAGEITLRRAARVASIDAITLGDVARIRGGASVELASIPLELDGFEDEIQRVSLAEVSDAIREAGHDPSRFAMSGSTCVVRTMRVAAPAGRERAPAAHDEPEWRPPSEASSFHHRIVGWLAETYRVGLADLKVEWGARDHAFLERDDDLSLAMHLVSSSDASRAVISVRLWDDGAIVESRTLRVDVTVRRHVVRTTREIGRDEIVGPGDVVAQSEFVRPSALAAPSSVENVVGMLASRRLEPGQIVTDRHLEPPTIVTRGQMVVLYCVRGSIEVRVAARAMEDGVMGQVIEITKQDSRERLFAKVNGPGLVTMGGEG